MTTLMNLETFQEDDVTERHHVSYIKKFSNKFLYHGGAELDLKFKKKLQPLVIIYLTNRYTKLHKKIFFHTFVCYQFTTSKTQTI